MDTALIKTLKDIFKQFPNFWGGETLQRSLVIDAIQKKEADVIKALINNEKIKTIYSTDIDGVLIFDFDKLISLLKYKEYWADSFTKYRNKVGLTSEGKYLDYSSNVVLDFPFKDCVLEGGMTKEDQGKNEVYYNEVIARDEIDRLFSPKVFTNTKRYTVDGVEEIVTTFTGDNLVIKGNNLIALHSLKERYKGKIKLIYIDPPYNTGEDSFKYNDRFNHSTWLTFMKNRLEIARDLLTEDGSIFIHTDDSEQAYLKVLCDEIFGRKNYMNTVSVQFKNTAGASGGGEDKRLKKNVEYLTIFVKNRDIHRGFNTIFSVTEIGELVQQYRDEGRSWKYTSVLIDDGEKEFLGETVDGSGASILLYKRVGAKAVSISSIMREENLTEVEAYNKYANFLFRTTNAQTSIRDRVASKAIELNNNEDIISIEYVPRSGKNKNQVYEQFYKGDSYNLFVWLKDTTDTVNGQLVKRDALGTSWNFIAETKNVNKEGGYADFSNGKKPELLISNIIAMASSEDDVVLDFHAGSGTTCAVAHKMGRRYIGVEQMDYINEITVPRMQKVIEGEQWGASEGADWQGGGSFVYTELMELNYLFIHKVEQAETTEELFKIFEKIKAEAHLNYQIDLERVLNTEYEIDGVDRFVSFSDLELSQQKQLLIELLDKNQLYVNFSEIEDKTFAISESDKAFTTSFYEGVE